MELATPMTTVRSPSHTTRGPPLSPQQAVAEGKEKKFWRQSRLDLILGPAINIEYIVSHIGGSSISQGNTCTGIMYHVCIIQGVPEKSTFWMVRAVLDRFGRLWTIMDCLDSHKVAVQNLLFGTPCTKTFTRALTKQSLPSSWLLWPYKKQFALAESYYPKFRQNQSSLQFVGSTSRSGFTDQIFQSYRWLWWGESCHNIYYSAFLAAP